MQIPYTLNREIVDFLASLPNMWENREQRALIQTAGFDPQLLNQINLSGSPAQFFQLLLPLLSSYGTLEDGRDAVEALLEAARQKVGRDQRIHATQLINKVRVLHGKAPIVVPEPEQAEPVSAEGPVTPVSETPATVSSTPGFALPHDNTPKVTIEIGTKTVYVRYAGHTYSGPNQLQAEELLKATTPDEYGEILFNGILHDIGSQANESDFTTRYGYTRAFEEFHQCMVTEIVLDPNDLSLYQYKWEYLKHPQKPMPLFLNERSPVYRRLEGVSQQIRMTANPLKILVTIANPAALGQPGNTLLQQLDPIVLEQERAVLETSLKRLQDAGMVEYTILDRHVTPTAIRQALKDGVHILHMISHGLFLPPQSAEKPEYYLVMEHDDITRQPFVSMNEFHAILHAGTQLGLVILAACQSAGKNTVDVLQGLGPSLVRHGIPAVIAMQDTISMDTARRFAQNFYDDLARSGRVDAAMAATRLALYNPKKPMDWGWGFPVLLMRAEHGEIFDVAPKA